MDNIYGEVGRRIRAKRLQLGMTLEDLADIVGSHASYIGQIERNTKKASLGAIAALADGLGVSVGCFFDNDTCPDALAVTKQLDCMFRSNSPAQKKLLLSVMRHLSKGLREMT